MPPSRFSPGCAPPVITWVVAPHGNGYNADMTRTLPTFPAPLALKARRTGRSVTISLLVTTAPPATSVRKIPAAR